MTRLLNERKAREREPPRFCGFLSSPNGLFRSSMERSVQHTLLRIRRECGIGHLTTQELEGFVELDVVLRISRDINTDEPEPLSSSALPLMWPLSSDSPRTTSSPFSSGGKGWSTLMSGVMPLPWIAAPRRRMTKRRLVRRREPIFAKQDDSAPTAAEGLQILRHH